jgi:HSP20 family protein
MNLPAAVNLEKIEAKYDKGVLTVTCPKKEEVKPKAIEIKTA